MAYFGPLSCKIIDRFRIRYNDHDTKETKTSSVRNRVPRKWYYNDGQVGIIGYDSLVEIDEIIATCIIGLMDQIVV